MDVATIRQTATLPAPPEDVYKALMDTRLHSRFTGSPARIGSKVGDVFTAYDGYIDGLNLALEPGRRIVQSWRAREEGWPEEHYSQVSYTLEAVEQGTRVVLRHDRVPAELVENFRQGWKEHYLEPLKALFRDN